MLRLTLDVDRGSRAVVIKGADAEEVLDRWNALPQWAGYDPVAFAERLVTYSGADDAKYVEEPVELPTDDEEILEKVVEAFGPEIVKLERLPDAR